MVCVVLAMFEVVEEISRRPGYKMEVSRGESRDVRKTRLEEREQVLLQGRLYRKRGKDSYIVLYFFSRPKEKKKVLNPSSYQDGVTGE